MHFNVKHFSENKFSFKFRIRSRQTNIGQYFFLKNEHQMAFLFSLYTFYQIRGVAADGETNNRTLVGNALRPGTSSLAFWLPTATLTVFYNRTAFTGIHHAYLTDNRVATTTRRRARAAFRRFVTAERCVVVVARSIATRSTFTDDADAFHAPPPPPR